MDKTIKINIAGTLFQIDEEAYRILRDYLQSVNNRFKNVHGGHETIEDIESRISEIFQSQNVLAGVITKDNVDAMISIIGKPEDFDMGEPEHESQVYATVRKRMYRNPDDSIISGVCGGIGAYLNADPVIFRILFVLFTAFFGIGFFIYAVLWISLPKANTDAKKREMYGNAYHSAISHKKQSGDTSGATSPLYNSGYYNSSGIGNAFNEIFRAIGRILYIIVRIILIITGVTLVITGFLFILAYVMIFIFNYPGTVGPGGFAIDLTCLPHFLTYIIKPSTAHWVTVLATIAFILPMVALIYWGVKMVIWFKAKDGLYMLAGFVLWVITIAILTIIFFTEGISFADSGSSTSQYSFPQSTDTLYVMTDHKAADLKFTREFAVPDNEYHIFFVDTEKRIYIKPRLNISVSDGILPVVEINKRSCGPTESDAIKKSESLIYNYKASKDTLYLDEYFTLPETGKWSADYVSVNLNVPKNTVLFFDKSALELFNRSTHISRVNHHVVRSVIEYHTAPWVLKDKYWIFSEEKEKETDEIQSDQ
jgi:phage shock protein PspC (stress-responsive transcriptional regulator)